jgi:hypothetical protein
MIQAMNCDDQARCCDRGCDIVMMMMDDDEDVAIVSLASLIDLLPSRHGWVIVSEALR